MATALERCMRRYERDALILKDEWNRYKAGLADPAEVVRRRALLVQRYRRYHDEAEESEIYFHLAHDEETDRAYKAVARDRLLARLSNAMAAVAAYDSVMPPRKG